jgi:predicted RNA-binding Zn-ribbon protein involved in translation (DUF1610 family)
MSQQTADPAWETAADGLPVVETRANAPLWCPECGEKVDSPDDWRYIKARDQNYPEGLSRETHRVIRHEVPRTAGRYHTVGYVDSEERDNYEAKRVFRERAKRRGRAPDFELSSTQPKTAPQPTVEDLSKKGVRQGHLLGALYEAVGAVDYDAHDLMDRYRVTNGQLIALIYGLWAQRHEPLSMWAWVDTVAQAEQNGGLVLRPEASGGLVEVEAAWQKDDEADTLRFCFPHPDSYYHDASDHEDMSRWHEGVRTFLSEAGRIPYRANVTDISIIGPWDERVDEPVEMHCSRCDTDWTEEDERRSRCPRCGVVL